MACEMIWGCCIVHLFMGSKLIWLSDDYFYYDLIEDIHLEFALAENWILDFFTVRFDYDNMEEDYYRDEYYFYGDWEDDELEEEDLANMFEDQDAAEVLFHFDIADNFVAWFKDYLLYLNKFSKIRTNLLFHQNGSWSAVQNLKYIDITEDESRVVDKFVIDVGQDLHWADVFQDWTFFVFSLPLLWFFIIWDVYKINFDEITLLEFNLFISIISNYIPYLFSEYWAFYVNEKLFGSDELGFLMGIGYDDDDVESYIEFSYSSIDHCLWLKIKLIIVIILILLV